MASDEPTPSAYLSTFLTTTSGLIAPLAAKMAAVGKIDATATKRLDRARMVHTAISSKLPTHPRIEDLKKMTVEWVHGMVEATYPLESKLSDEECVDNVTLTSLLACLDGAHALVGNLTALYCEAGQVKTATAHSEEPAASLAGGAGASGGKATSDCQAGGSSDAPAERPTREQVAVLLQGAVAAGAPLQEVVPHAAAEAQVLGQELWEALCWRRGALRFYIAKSAMDRHQAKAAAAAEAGASARASAAPGNGSIPTATEAGAIPASAATNLAAGASAVEIGLELLEQGHAALLLLLNARRAPTESFDDPPEEKDEEEGEEEEEGSANSVHASATAAAAAAATVTAGVGAGGGRGNGRRAAAAAEAVNGNVVTLKYGVYSTTHLLALAFDAELCYWRWAVLRRQQLPPGASQGAPGAPPSGIDSSTAAVDVSDAPSQLSSSTAEAPGKLRSGRGTKDELEVTRWFRLAVIRVHRYLHTVDVLMEGCGWDTRRSRELLSLLAADHPRTMNVSTALRGEVGVAERELAALKIASAGECGAPGDAGGVASTRHGGKKGNKKGKGKAGR
jgi:hypothetical protein